MHKYKDFLFHTIKISKSNQLINKSKKYPFQMSNFLPHNINPINLKI